MSARTDCTAVVVAAGAARRMQGIDKILEPLCGIPVIVRTVSALEASGEFDRLVLVTRPDLFEKLQALLGSRVMLVAGGNSRAESVQNGLSRVTTAYAAIHDGARPLISADVISEAVAAAKRYGAAAPAIPVTDTVKVAQAAVVTETPDRKTLFAVQTPQVFRTELICSALEKALTSGLLLTDDCSAVEATGYPVRLTAGSPENIKLTAPVDFALAEAIIKWRERS